MLSGLLRSLTVLTFALSAVAHAQVQASLRLAKKEVIAGEAIPANLTLTNNSGRELTLQGDGRISWLDLVVKNSRGIPVSPRGNAQFGPIILPAGQSLTRRIDLNQYYRITELDSYSVYAVVRPNMNDRQEGFMSNRLLFQVTTGQRFWHQKFGFSGQTREFVVLTSSGEKGTQLYAQVLDANLGTPLSTATLGTALMFREPSVTLDGQQMLHILALISPAMYQHTLISPNGAIISQTFHQRAAQGEPSLVTFGDGSVQVANSIPYDAKAAAEERAKGKKASDRPPGF